ncbi:hypothetical protein EJB05_51603, partial [Eragrostis curvula]
MKIAKKCVVCSRAHEDGGHLFFKCKLAKTVWLATNLEHVRAQLVSFGSAKDVVITILGLKAEVQAKVIALMWSLWDERNRIREGEKRKTAGFLTHGAELYAAEILKFFGKDEGASRGLKPKLKWERPSTVQPELEKVFLEPSCWHHLSTIGRCLTVRPPLVSK